jgi:hypothetical protein
MRGETIMPNSTQKLLRVSAATACAIALAVTAHFLWPTPTSSTEILLESHSSAALELAALTRFPSGATLFLD